MVVFMMFFEKMLQHMNEIEDMIWPVKFETLYQLVENGQS